MAPSSGVGGHFRQSRMLVNGASRQCANQIYVCKQTAGSGCLSIECNVSDAKCQAIDLEMCLALPPVGIHFD